MSKTLFSIGYGAWKNTRTRTSGMLGALLGAKVTLLVDIRHSPCASDPTGNTNYSARSWHLQSEAGIQAELRNYGIDYRWIVELGNPQKRDRKMVILRKHLDSQDLHWPVNRGLQLLRDLVEENPNCCLLCACAEYEACHRKLVAESARDHCDSEIQSIVNLTPTGDICVG